LVSPASSGSPSAPRLVEVTFAIAPADLDAARGQLGAAGFTLRSGAAPEPAFLAGPALLRLSTGARPDCRLVFVADNAPGGDPPDERVAIEPAERHIADLPETLEVGANRIFAIAGVSLLSDNPVAGASATRDILSKPSPIRRDSDSAYFVTGFHFVRYLSPAGFDFYRKAHAGADSVVHMLCEDFATTQLLLDGAGMRTVRTADESTGLDTLLVSSPYFSALLAVTEREIADWLEERAEVTGETLAR
jgi:hypothetical protein